MKPDILGPYHEFIFDNKIKWDVWWKEFRRQMTIADVEEKSTDSEDEIRAVIQECTAARNVQPGEVSESETESGSESEAETSESDAHSDSNSDE